MNTNRQTAIKENKMKLTASGLIRWAGLSAMGAGIIFVGIQPIHPPDVLASVTTTQWGIIQSLKTVMCLLGLLGMAGIYARQAEEAGWLGLVGLLLFSLFFAHTLPIAYTEAFILPVLATEAPTFVEGFLGIFNGHPSEMYLGALPVLYVLAGFGYVLAACCLASRRSAPVSCRAGRVACLPSGPYCPSLRVRWSRTRSIGYLRCRWG